MEIEKTITLEELQAMDLGGNDVRIFKVDELKKPKKFKVKDVTGVKTEWGIRCDYVIHDEFTEYKISSWNIVSKGKMKVTDILGKEIELSPSTNFPKKVELKVLN